jgi:hypothetical protein
VFYPYVAINELIIFDIKPIPMKSFKRIRIITLFSLFVTVLIFSSCTSTKVIASNYGDTIANNTYYQTSDWSYLWGMYRKDVYVGKDGDGTNYALCTEGSLANVEVETTFGGYFLSLVTLGIVNHRKVKYACSRPADGDGGMDD